jgi:hypothetical protein
MRFSGAGTFIIRPAAGTGLGDRDDQQIGTELGIGPPHPTRLVGGELEEEWPLGGSPTVWAASASQWMHGRRRSRLAEPVACWRPPTYP